MRFFCRGERLFAREWISVQAKGMTEEVLIRISLSDDIPSRHPDNAPGQDPCPSRKRDRREENRQSLFSLTALSRYLILSLQRLLEIRSRAKASRDDSHAPFRSF